MFKPMLAGKAPKDLTLLTYPVLASPKLDGIRCIIINSQARSRSMKLIPNVSVRRALEGLPDGIDGELMVDGGFSACSSAFMSRDKVIEDFWFFAFDWNRAHEGFEGDGLDVSPAFSRRLQALTMWS